MTPPEPRALILSALDRMAVGLVGEAEVLLEAALASLRSTTPAVDWRALVSHARALVQRGDYAGAWPIYSAAMEVAARQGPEAQVTVLQGLGAAQDGCGRYGLAVDTWAAAVRLATEHELGLFGPAERCRSSLEAWATFPRYFVSFTRADKMALTIARAIKAENPDRVTIDESDFVSGLDIGNLILSKMKDCTSIILLVGPEYLARPWTHREVQVAADLSAVSLAWAEGLDAVFAASNRPDLDSDAHVLRLHAGGGSRIRRIVPVSLVGLSEPPFLKDLLWADGSMVDTEAEAARFAQQLLGRAASDVGATQ